MHQHQLVAFTTKYRFFAGPNSTSQAPRFTETRYDEEDKYSFLSPVKRRRTLTKSQLKHLQQHYLTEYELPNIRHPDLTNIDEEIQVWYRCQFDQIIFHCEEYRRSNSTRLSSLACIQQTVDQNASFSSATRPERMVLKYFYVDVKFYCVHKFRGRTHMLMYSQYRNVREENGLVVDRGGLNHGFQDVTVLHRLCARVPGAGGHMYIVDDHGVLQEHLYNVIRRRGHPGR
jgi:hypothetical protein